MCVVLAALSRGFSKIAVDFNLSEAVVSVQGLNHDVDDPVSALSRPAQPQREMVVKVFIAPHQSNTVALEMPAFTSRPPILCG